MRLVLDLLERLLDVRSLAPSIDGVAQREHVFPYSKPWRGLSIMGAFLLLVLAMNVYVDRFQLLLEHHDGITYTDAHVTIHGLLIVCAALVLGAVNSAYNAARHSRGRWIVAAILPAVVCYGVLAIVGWYVGSFIVKPNKLVREEPFIAHNIEMTRQAYRLNRFAQREFPAETTVDAVDPANNQPTLQNIRLWDGHALQDALGQVQEIRTYYDFPDIDIDRYKIDGTTRQVMLAARELNVEKQPPLRFEVASIRPHRFAGDEPPTAASFPADASSPPPPPSARSSTSPLAPTITACPARPAGSTTRPSIRIPGQVGGHGRQDEVEGPHCLAEFIGSTSRDEAPGTETKSLLILLMCGTDGSYIAPPLRKVLHGKMT